MDRPDGAPRKLSASYSLTLRVLLDAAAGDRSRRSPGRSAPPAPMLGAIDLVRVETAASCAT